MSATPTVIPAVKRKLKERLEASADLTGVPIVVGEENRTPAEQIILGNGTSKPQFAGLGTRVPLREDPVRISCLAEVVRQGNPDVLDLEQRVADIVGAITDVLRADPDLGATWQFGLITDFQLSSGVVDKGRAARIAFVLEGKSRHP